MICINLRLKIVIINLSQTYEVAILARYNNNNNNNNNTFDLLIAKDHDSNTMFARLTSSSFA